MAPVVPSCGAAPLLIEDLSAPEVCTGLMESYVEVLEGAMGVDSVVRWRGPSLDVVAILARSCEACLELALELFELFNIDRRR